MRPDLAKLTTEQERAGGYGKIKHGGKVRINHDPEHDYLDEFGGFRSSARHRHDGNTGRRGTGKASSKSLTDVLNPLRGQLRKNLGRPWDKVFSEFCKVLDRRSVAGYHIWTHLMWEVETKTYLGVDGNIYSWGRGGGSPTRVNGNFYVHPVSGLLCWEPEDKTRHWWRYRKEEKPVKVRIDDEWHYEQIDGLWFRCRLVEKVDRIFGNKIYIAEKYSANRKEIQWIKTKL